MKLSQLCFYTIFQSCICCAIPVFGAHIKHKKSISQYDNHFWFNEVNADSSEHTSDTNDILHNYESYRPEMSETNNPSVNLNHIHSSGSLPPYYLSYDSGQKTRYQAMEEQLIEQQMADENYGRKTDPESTERTITMNYDKESKIKTENQVKEEEDLDNIYKNRNENGLRRVGRLGLKGIFGFWSANKFYPCDKPRLLRPDSERPGTFVIPDNINYYHKCQYFDSDPRRRLQRRVGKLGKNGFFGYFEDSRFIVCEAPKELEQDSNAPDVYYISNTLEYDPKCQYFENNISKRFDFLIDRQNFSVQTAQTIGLTYLLPYCLLVFIFNSCLTHI